MKTKIILVMTLLFGAVNYTYADNSLNNTDGLKVSEQEKSGESIDPFTKEKVAQDDKKKKKPSFLDKLHDKYKDETFTDSFYNSLDKLDNAGK